MYSANTISFPVISDNVCQRCKYWQELNDTAKNFLSLPKGKWGACNSDALTNAVTKSKYRQCNEEQKKIVNSLLNQNRFRVIIHDICAIDEEGEEIIKYKVTTTENHSCSCIEVN